jgi:hypothetical protein
MPYAVLQQSSQKERGRQEYYVFKFFIKSSSFWFMQNKEYTKTYLLLNHKKCVSFTNNICLVFIFMKCVKWSGQEPEGNTFSGAQLIVTVVTAIFKSLRLIQILYKRVCVYFVYLCKFQCKSLPD